MPTNVTKSSTTPVNSSKSGISVYGTATYGGWSYNGGRIPTNVSKSSVTSTMQPKS